MNAYAARDNYDLLLIIPDVINILVAYVISQWLIWLASNET